jgi:hypothetical protein
VQENFKVSNESPLLAEPTVFTIMTLDTVSEPTGIFKSKKYIRNRLSEMYDIYNDILKIRRRDSNIIMVAN